MKHIFISYSHKDKKWKKLLVSHLKVLERQDICKVWDDQKIKLGKDWYPEIEEAINKSDTAIMLISKHFLDSDFILDEEIPRILERREKGELEVIPIFAEPCAWENVPWLNGIQGFPPDGKTLLEFGESQSEKVLAELAAKLVDKDKNKSKPTQPNTFSRQKQPLTKVLTPLPPRQVQLIGRDEDLKRLETLVKKSDRAVLVNGLGGIGKTEVCKRFFLNHYNQYTHAAWVDYVSSIKESLVNAFGSETARYHPGLIEPSPGDTLDERFNKIMAVLNRLDANSLLVIDNIENPEDEDLLSILSLPFKVVANSRLNLQGFETFSLDFLSPRSCKELFYRYYKGKPDDTNVEKIVERCGNHTLTVELLARSAQNAAMTIKGLYNKLKEKGFNLDEVIRDKVVTFWHNEKERKRFFGHLLKIFDLSGVTEKELDVLTNLSVLPAVPIDMNECSEWLGLETKEEINGLVNKGWLKREAKAGEEGFTIFMHQVLQEVICHNAEPDAKKCGGLITSLANKLFLDPGDNPIEKKEYVIFAEVLVRHMEDDNDEELARLSNNLSLIYKALSRLEKALEFQEKAVEIREAVLDKNHPDLATSYNNLSTIYQDLGQLEKALEFQEKSTKIKENTLDKNHPSLATSYNNLSSIYKALGQLEKALEFQNKASKIYEEVLDKNHPLLATSYNNLSMIYKDLGKLEKALEFQQKAIKIREAVLDKNHPDLATSYNNLSLIYQDLGQLEKALEFQEKAVAILQKLFPNGHYNLDTALQNLEMLKQEMDR